MTVAVAVALALAALFVTFFVRPKDVPEPLPISPVQHLEDRKQAIYDNLRDLQFEYRLGKLSDEDYQRTKQALQKELAGVLADIEETLLRFGLPPSRPAAAKAQSTPQAAPKAAVARNSGVTCVHCGATFQEALKFCGECGKAIHEEVRS